MNGESYQAWKLPPASDTDWRAPLPPPARRGVRAGLAALRARLRRMERV